MASLRNARMNLMLSHWSINKILCYASALTIYVGIFAGRFSFARILPGIFPEWLVLGEVRTWALLVCNILAAVSWRFCKPMESPVNKTQIWRSVGLVVIVQIAIIVHALFYKFGHASAYFLWELLVIVLEVIILAVFCRIWGEQLIDAIMWVALIFAISSVGWIWGALIYSKIAINENPMGTTFTFYRMQIFGGFSALVIHFRRGKKNGLGILLVLSSVLCFAGAFLTLSKAALLVGTMGLLLLAAIYVTWFEKLKAVTVMVVFVSALTLFVMVSGSMFTARVSEGVLGTGYALNLQSVAPLSKEEALTLMASIAAKKPSQNVAISSSEGARILADSYFDAQLRMANILACTAGGYPCGIHVERWEKDIVDSMLQYRVYIPDYSFRIRLFMHALSGISKAPWLGNGFGDFHAVAINLYTKKPDHYFHPHNVLLELLYAVGILGTLFVAAIFLILVWQVLRARNQIQPCLPMFAFVVSIGLGSLFGGDYMDFRLVWVGLLLCIMLCKKNVLSILSLPEAVK